LIHKLYWKALKVETEIFHYRGLCERINMWYIFKLNVNIIETSLNAYCLQYLKALFILPKPTPFVFFHLLSLSIKTGEILSLLQSTSFIILPLVGSFVIQRIIGIGGTEESLYTEEDRSDLQSGTPFIFKDIKANSAEIINIGVVDLGVEDDLRGVHGVFISQQEFSVEDTTFIRSVGGSVDFNKEVLVVGGVNFDIDTRDFFSGELLGFLEDTRSWSRHVYWGFWFLIFLIIKKLRN